MIGRLSILAWLIGMLATASAVAQPVKVKVRSVGFEAGVLARYVVRYGQWFPIQVELDAFGSQPQQVTLRCTKTDLDGDLVDYIEAPVVVTPDAGTKRAWLYASTSPMNTKQHVVVDVLGANGALLARSDPLAFEPVSHDYQVVLDISDTPVTALRRLSASSGDYFDRLVGQHPYYRNRCVVRLRARDLPDRWIGLEAADVIVWDLADPTQFRNPDQITALREWVRRGGRLVLGLGAAWPKLRISELAELLPLTGGRVQEVDALPGLLQTYGQAGMATFPDPVPVALADLVPGGRALLRDIVGKRPIDLVAMRAYGSGRVIVSAMRLRDLFALSNPAKSLPLLFDLNKTTEKYLLNESVATMGFGPIWLYRSLMTPTEFRGQASVLVLLAFLFVAVYIVLSTGASWLWLKRKRLTQLSWSVFAGFAVVASLLSIGAVRVMRGIGDQVRTVSLVDLDAGSTQGSARVFIGYTSPVKQRVDLRLNCDDGFVRALTSVGGETLYATPERYQAIPRIGTLRQVPMRATLKQFEGVWTGSHTGTIRAQLTANRNTGQITPESWIANDLGVDIAAGYLLLIDPRLSQHGGVPLRAAGLSRRPRSSMFHGETLVPPPVNVLAVTLGPIPDKQTIRQIGQKAYADYASAYQRWRASATTPDPHTEPVLPTLWSLQTGVWINSLRAGLSLRARVDPVMAAALMASTADLYLPTDGSRDFDRPGTPISLHSLPNVDVTHWLTGGAGEGVAVLLLYVNAPGPATLVHGEREIPPRRGVCLYRVRVPIRWKS